MAPKRTKVQLKVWVTPSTKRLLDRKVAPRRRTVFVEQAILTALGKRNLDAWVPTEKPTKAKAGKPRVLDVDAAVRRYLESQLRAGVDPRVAARAAMNYGTTLRRRPPPR